MDEGSLNWSYLPDRLRKKLLPFQLKGVRYAIEKDGRCLIGDEMGLGKTLQAIAAAYYYYSEWPMLVVLPSSMKYPWIEELEKWLPCLQPSEINLISSSTDVSNIPQASVSLVGYGLMQSNFKTLIEALHKQEFKVIVVDESHFLKNPKAARTKTLVPLLLKAKRVLMLSGTPALARPAELFSQINCLRKGQFGSWSNFAKKYCNAQWKFYGRVRKWDTSGASNLKELHQKLTSTVMIRRQKKEVLSQLPPKRRQKVPFELAESKQKKELDTIWEELGLYLKGEIKPKDGGDAGFEIRKLAMNLFISTGKAKIGAVSEYVKMLLDNPEMKFLVFAHHKEVLTSVVQTVQVYAREKEPSLKYIRIDGDVPCLERMKDVNRFQQDPNVRVAALSIMAAGTGLTLTAASHVVFAELHWTPGVLEQCEDRAHRIGQANAIHVHYLIAKGTIDEWMWSALNKKISVLSSTLNGHLQAMNVEELGGGIGEFLKQAAFWLPSSLDFEEDDSFFFSQTPKKLGTRDIRSYMQANPPSGETSAVKSVTSKDIPLQVINCSDEDTILCQEEDNDDDEIIDLTDSKDKYENKEDIRSKIKCSSDVKKTSEEIGMAEKGGVIYKERTEILQRGAELDTKGCRKVTKMKKGEVRTRDGKDKEKPGVVSTGVSEIENGVKVPCYRRKDSLGETTLADSKEEDEEVPFYESVEKLSKEMLDDRRDQIDLSTIHTCTSPSIKNVLHSENDEFIGDSDLSDSDCEVIVGVTSFDERKLSSQNYTPRSSQSMHSLDLENGSKCHSSVNSPQSTEASSTKTELNKSNCNNVSRGQSDSEPLENQWNCPACTFLNHESLPLCEICDTPRKQKQTSRVTRKMISKKLKEKQKRMSQMTVVETLSDSDEDFEMLQRVVLDSGGSRKSAMMDNNVRNKKTNMETKELLEIKDRVCDTFQTISESDVASDSFPLSACNCSETVGIQCKHNRGLGQVPQLSDLSKLEVKVSKQEEEGKTITADQNFTDVLGNYQGSKHGIDISESDSDDSIFNMDPLNCDQEGLDMNTHPEDSKMSLNTTLSRDSSSAEEKGEEIQEHSSVTENVLHVKDDDSEIRSGRKNCFHTSPGNFANDSSGSSVLGNSDSLFSDDEKMQENFNDKIKDSGRLESRKDVALTQEAIENELKDVIECLMNSPLTSQTAVEPWTCPESSCRHVNTTSDVECENCWASKPSQSSDSVEGFGLSKSLCFMSASDFFTRQGNDVVNISHESRPLKSPTSQRTDEEAPFQFPTQRNTRTASFATNLSQSGFQTEEGKDAVKLKPRNLPTLEDSDISANVCIKPKVYESFLYCASKYTDRIYLYDEDQNPLNSAFFPLDLRICDMESLPSILLVKQNMKVAHRFLREWDSLTEMKKRKIKKSGLIFDSPLAAVDSLMKKRPFELSTKRFITKDDLANAALKKADEVGGSIRVIHKTNTRARLLSSPSASGCQFVKSSVAGRKRKDAKEGETEDGSNERRQESCKKLKTKAASSIESSGKYSFVQALSADGHPLCVFCNGQIENTNVSNDNAAWDTRYCSELCKQENQVRWKKSKYVREQLLEVEHGICQMCGLDAHSIFKTLRDLPKSQRKKHLSETPYANLSVKQLNDMIRSPSEGQFWHADHIIPVYKGGGLCSLENFRTLCVLCHTKVTVEQGQERKKERQEAAHLKEGLRDIRKFLLDKG